MDPGASFRWTGLELESRAPRPFHENQRQVGGVLSTPIAEPCCRRLGENARMGLFGSSARLGSPATVSEGVV